MSDRRETYLCAVGHEEDVAGGIAVTIIGIA
jgi:hypothetical protein